jgi:RNA polymerase sigma-70 factor (ECF subfamily)
MAPALRSLRLVHGGSPAGEPQSPEADAGLLEAVRAGKTAAAGEFHDRVRPIVERTLGRLLGSGDPDRDDLTQQALIELVLSVDRFRGECPLDAWVAVIAARTVYKHIRRRTLERRLFVLGSPESLELLPDRAAGSLTLHRSSLRRVERHLREMDRSRAWTYLLHDVHGFSLKQISDITHAGVAAVQSRLVRGRKELHARIAEDVELAAGLEDLSDDSGGSHG